MREVATVYQWDEGIFVPADCATSNPLQVILEKLEDGRSVICIIDGVSSRAIESEDDKKKRSKLLRDLGYKK